MGDKAYLVWSHEHRAWWRPGGNGYTPRLSEAGLFTHDEALAICADAIPGTAARLGALPELPVSLDDVRVLQARFHDEYPNLPSEAWE